MYVKLGQNVTTDCVKFRFLEECLVPFTKTEKSEEEVCFRIGKENDDYKYRCVGVVLLYVKPDRNLDSSWRSGA